MQPNGLLNATIQNWLNLYQNNMHDTHSDSNSSQELKNDLEHGL